MYSFTPFCFYSKHSHYMSQNEIKSNVKVLYKEIYKEKHDQKAYVTKTYRIHLQHPAQHDF